MRINFNAETKSSTLEAQPPYDLGVLFRDDSLQMGTGDPLELYLISKLQRPAPLEKQVLGREDFVACPPPGAYPLSGNLPAPRLSLVVRWELVNIVLSLC